MTSAVMAAIIEDRPKTKKGLGNRQTLPASNP
jgi:hypothetical protein